MGQNGDSEFEFVLTLDSYLLSEIENMRRGRNLNFVVEILLLASDNKESHTTESEYPFVLEFEVPKSKWKEDILPHLLNRRITFVSIPNIEACRALNDGRYGDVFEECRESLTALSKGIDEWVHSVLTDEDINKIQTSAEKENTRRNIGFSKLVGHAAIIVCRLRENQERTVNSMAYQLSYG